MLKTEIWLIFIIGIDKQDKCHMTDRWSLKNFCLVNYSQKWLICPVQAHIVRSMVLNGNEQETLNAYISQVRQF